MAIAITGCTVVGLKSRIELKFSGGLDALSRQVPNRTCLADDDLWRCAFMSESEGVKFIELLQDAGLEAQRGPDPDIVMVNEFDQTVTPYCEWLQTTKIQKGVIAWRVGTTPRTVTASQDWSFEEGSGLIFSDSSRDENLEFLRLEGNVSVYFNKQLGKEVYLGRTWPDPNEVYKDASRIIVEYSVHPGSPKLEGEAEARVRVAVSKLEELALEMPDQWMIHWSLGKGRRAIGDLQGAYESFRAAYALHTEYEDIPREYAGSCLELGFADEAVNIGQKAAALRPDNPETLGNLACAYLFATRYPEAMATVNAALKMNPEVGTNLYIRNLISDVQSGIRPQPRTLFDVTAPCHSPPKSSPIEPAAKKRPFWKRWFLPLVIFSFFLRSLSAADQLAIRVEPTGWGDAGPEDVRKVLESVGSELIRHVPPERLIRIHVVPHDAAPQVDNVRSPDGEYTVRLNVKGRYWAQFAFQFAHELGHIVSHYERSVDNDLGEENRWFDEAIGEAASLFVMRRMAHTWEVAPPYPHWKSFAPELGHYITARAQEIEVPPPEQMPVWFADNHAALRTEPLHVRSRNRVVAAHLARILDEHPEHWEAFRYLTLGRPDKTNSFEAYLENWYFSVPKAQKPFVKEIVDLLGVKCPLIADHAAK